MLKRYIRTAKNMLWFHRLRERIRNTDFSLITNNCIGGVIYHNLELQFKSPTINLYIQGAEYLDFCQNLKEYTLCELIEEKNTDYMFPVGKLMRDRGEIVHVYFQHYKTFEEAKRKWVQRCARINFDNLFIPWEFYDTEHDFNLLREYDKLPFPHIALLHREIENIASCVVVDYYDNDKPFGKILQYDGCSGKRFLDRIDYVSFLNTMK